MPPFTPPVKGVGESSSHAWHIHHLPICVTNEELYGIMRFLAAIREGTEHVGVYLTGFEQDSRELRDIPEVVAFCRRLTDQGFISYLDVSFILPELRPRSLPPAAQLGGIGVPLGSLDIWLMGSRRYEVRPENGAAVIAVEHSTILQFLEELKTINDCADRVVGTST